MKAKVRIQFHDTGAKRTRVVGEIFECTAERFNEIRDKGAFIEAVEDQKPTKAQMKG